MSKSTKGYIYALLCSLLYGLIAPISKLFSNKISLYQIFFLLYLGSAVILLLILLLNKKERSTLLKIKKRDGNYILAVVLCEVFASLLYLQSLRLLSASVISLLGVLETMATIILSIFFFNAKIDFKLFLAVIFMCLGGIFISFDFTNIYFSLAIVLMIVVDFIYGLKNNLVGNINASFSILISFLQSLVLTIVYFILIFSQSNLFTLFNNYWFLLILGFLMYGLAILLYACATKIIGTNKTTLLYSSSPLFSILFSILFLGEHLTVNFLFSMFLMFIGVFFTVEW